MVLETEIAEIEKQLTELDQKIDTCTSEMELNQIGNEIRGLEDQLEPLKRAAELHARLEASVAVIKKRVEQKRPRM